MNQHNNIPSCLT